MERHFVTFYSPGTLVAETTEQPIDTWDVEEAVRRARTVVERYGAIPYGFRFTTRGRQADELDSHVTQRSSMYYLGGKIETLEEVKARATEKDQILIGNMEGNGWGRIITNSNSWSFTAPLQDDDIVLPFEVQR